MPQKVTYITPKGLAKLEGDLEYLRTVKRPEITKHLQDTMGNEEDPEYLLTLEAQAFVEGRILELESLLSCVQVIEPGQNNNDGLVKVGSTVVLREHGMEVETFTIVGSTEANPAEGLVSNESPLGKVLIGKKAGEDVSFKAPVGTLQFRVVAVQ